MDGVRLESLVRRGFAKAARHVSLPYHVYRPVQRMWPIQLIGQRPDILATFSPKQDFEFNAPPSIKDVLQSCLTNDTSLAHGDYLLGPSGTFFVSKTAHLTAPTCVLCNHTLELRRVMPPEGFGALRYRAEVAQEETIIARLPGSLMRSSQGGRHEAGLPGAPSAPEVMVLWPDLAQIGPDDRNPSDNPVSQAWRADQMVIRTSDAISDDMGRRWAISAAELTGFGWRLWCRLLATG
jgi:hypothetical protein